MLRRIIIRERGENEYENKNNFIFVLQTTPAKTIIPLKIILFFFKINKLNIAQNPAISEFGRILEP